MPSLILLASISSNAKNLSAVLFKTSHNNTKNSKYKQQKHIVLEFVANLIAFRATNILCCVCKLNFISIYKLLHLLKMLHIT